MTSTNICTFVFSYHDIPISVLDKYRHEQHTLATISIEIQSNSSPNIDIVEREIYRPDQRLTIHEIPMMLLNIREQIQCTQLVFYVHFPYVLRKETKKPQKCSV